MIVAGVPARPITLDMFGDITTAAISSMTWQAGYLEVTFTADLTPAQVEAVKRRMASRNANEETLQEQAFQALQNNRDFLAIGTPTNAQVLTQVKALTRQNNGIIRQLLGFLDGID
jgi:predicted ATPase